MHMCVYVHIGLMTYIPYTIVYPISTCTHIHTHTHTDTQTHTYIWVPAVAGHFWTAVFAAPHGIERRRTSALFPNDVPHRLEIGSLISKNDWHMWGPHKIFRHEVTVDKPTVFDVDAGGFVPKQGIRSYLQNGIVHFYPVMCICMTHRIHVWHIC